MSELERIVRPFAGFPALPGLAPPQPAVEPQTENVRLEIGKDSGTKTYSGSFSANVSRYMDANVKEKKRETSEKRVENPDDPSQFVNVERVDKLTTNGVNGQKTNVEFKNKK
jgi:hypothetical protein